VRERLAPLSSLWGTGAVVALLSTNWTKVLRVPPEQTGGKEFNFRVTTDYITSAERRDLFSPGVRYLAGSGPRAEHPG
jgi:hypothetical protein